MLKREWGVESNGKLPHLSIPSKTATLVPKFALEDLPSGRTAPWSLSLQWKTCSWAEYADDDYDDDDEQKCTNTLTSKTTLLSFHILLC